MMTIKELESAWNARTDKHKDWSDIDTEEEMIEFAQEMEIEACAKICDEYDDRWTNLSAYLIRDRLNKGTGEKS